MGRILRFTLIGCGGLVALVVLLGIVGALVGGGGDTQAPEQADEPAQEEQQQDAEQEVQERAEEEQQEQQQEPEPDPEPEPAQEEEADTVTIRVTGDQGLGFTGNYGNMDGQRSVEGTIPAEYAQPVNTGMMEFDTVSAVFQSQGSGRLKVALVYNGEVVREQETTAEFGVVQANWSPQE